MIKERNAWLDKVFRHSHSYNSRKAGEMALKAFDRIFEQPIEDYVDKLECGEIDPYSLLDRFSAELDRKELNLQYHKRLPNEDKAIYTTKQISNNYRTKTSI
ncbi:MAG: hypothetical protein QW193_05005 [Nitrososphaerales archaeon]